MLELIFTDASPNYRTALEAGRALRSYMAGREIPTIIA